MKKVISLFLALVMMISMSVPAFAAASSEEYYTIQVEYSDNIGNQESLDIMIQNDNVFVDAEMLAERLGYTFGENGESAVILNKDTSNNLPFGITQFKYNSTQVSHMLFNNMIDTYEAPFASVKNNEGSWIPFEYSLLLFNSGMMLTDDAVLIDIPTKRIIDYFYDVAKNSTKYGFDWADDFGYTETDIKVLGGSSHLINVFNGVLGFDGASWASLFQQFAGSMDSYDKKYGENLAMLLCTESDKELQASIDQVDMFINLLDEDGNLGEILSSTSALLDSQVGTLYENCEDVLQKVKDGNSPLVSYNKSYQALEAALDRQTWFSNTGGNILEVQKGISSAAGKAFTVLDVGTKVLEVVGYAQEFQNQDSFSLAAFTHYLDTANNGLELPEKMKESMVDYSDTLSDNIGEYMTKRFTENVGQWIIDEIPMHEVLGIQAAGALFAWDIASNTIPFISNGLSGADNFELALYSMVFQGDTFLNYLSKRDSVFANAENITAEHMYELSQYCYIYLKSCYVTREAALASLANKSDSTKEKIQSLIDYQNSINTEIAKIMVELKGANKTNDGLVFGFLPTDNEDYLDKYDNSQLIQWIETPIDMEINYEMRTETIEFRLSDGTLYYSNTIEYPYFSGNSAIESTLNQRYADMISDCKTNDTDFDASYQENLEWGLDASALPFYDDTLSEVAYNDRGAFSIKETYLMWSGGAHPYHYESALNYDLTTGAELTYFDILDGTDEEIDSILRHYFEKSLWTPTDYEVSTLKEYTAYALCKDGLCFYYNVGDAVPRAEIIIPYTSDDTYVISVNKLL